MSPDLERAYQEHSLPLYRFLVRFTGDGDVAADVVQEAFLRLVDRPPRAERLRSWLYRVAINLAREVGRTRTRRLRLLAAGPPDAFVADTPPDPQARLEVLEKRQAVQGALARLATRDRTILLMRAEGFSLQEIAQVVGTRPSSVGTLLARALSRLSRELHLDAAEGVE